MVPVCLQDRATLDVGKGQRQKRRKIHPRDREQEAALGLF